jgi:hypothetical protein
MCTIYSALQKVQWLNVIDFYYHVSMIGPSGGI